MKEYVITDELWKYILRMDYQNEAECKDSASTSLLLSAYKDVI